jgi:hypothetical protein
MRSERHHNPGLDYVSYRLLLRAAFQGRHIRAFQPTTCLRGVDGPPNNGQTADQNAITASYLQLAANPHGSRLANGEQSTSCGEITTCKWPGRAAFQARQELSKRDLHPVGWTTTMSIRVVRSKSVRIFNLRVLQQVLVFLR